MMNLLIINKDIDTANLLKFQLEKNNFIVTHIENSDKAIEICQNYLFDVIVFDFDEKENLDVNIFEKLKETNPEIIIILTVEFGSADAAIKACKKGPDDYLAKPFGVEHLMFTIEKVKKTKELIKENEMLQKKLKDRK